jgi:hypothetical protein
MSTRGVGHHDQGRVRDAAVLAAPSQPAPCTSCTRPKPSAWVYPNGFRASFWAAFDPVQTFSLSHTDHAPGHDSPLTPNPRQRHTNAKTVSGSARWLDPFRSVTVPRIHAEGVDKLDSLPCGDRCRRTVCARSASHSRGRSDHGSAGSPTYPLCSGCWFSI